MSNQLRIIDQIIDEREKQDIKWGQQDHSPMKWSAILSEENGEVAQATLQRKYEEYRKELIQVAAVAIAAIECLDRDMWT